jgi:septal ring factor EnvC (AmiA/AmiB activator)
MTDDKKQMRAEVEKQLRKLEKRIDRVLEEVIRLQQQNRELGRKLAESERIRAEAAARIDQLLDKLEKLV